MQRRGESGQRVKGRRTPRPKAHKTPTARVATADLQEQVAALTRELKEAREQQAATSEVLQVISGSAGELAPVFESLLASAKHLCGAEFGAIFLREGDGFRIVALHAASAETLRPDGTRHLFGPPLIPALAVYWKPSRWFK